MLVDLVVHIHSRPIFFWAIRFHLANLPGTLPKCDLLGLAKEEFPSTQRNFVLFCSNFTMGRKKNTKKKLKHENNLHCAMRL